MTARAALAALVADWIAAQAPDIPELGVAVSGGSDSLSLLLLLNDVAGATGLRLEAATVDHGLRPEAQDEARHVARTCDTLGIPHQVLTCTSLTGQGNLQAAARAARYAALVSWAQARNLGAVCLGHTQDDQAETLLMRLMRGSGVDGLAAMSGRTERNGMIWLRPMLGLRRNTLRQMLRDEGWDWCEDPTNTDPAYDRVRTRQAIATLGLDVPRLADTAAAMARAREVLGRRAVDIVRAGAVRFLDGDVLLETEVLAATEAETRLRLLAEALRWVSGATYRPRLAALEALWSTVQAGTRATLHGCLVLPRRGQLHVCREYQAVATLKAPLGTLWDARWRLSLPGSFDATVRALGPEGLRQITYDKGALPHASLLATPAIWSNDRVLSVPRLKWGLSGRIDSAPSPDGFMLRLIQH